MYSEKNDAIFKGNEHVSIEMKRRKTDMRKWENKFILSFVLNENLPSDDRADTWNFK